MSMSGEQRREGVIRAAITEFAWRGYHGTSTRSIARRAGVSQPYLFRLFPDKRSIFITAALQCVTDIRLTFEGAVKDLDNEVALLAMADAYTRLISEHPETLRMQLQAYATVGELDARGDHRFGETVRAEWMRLWDTVHLLCGTDAQTTLFLARSMLINVLASMDSPSEHRLGRETAT